MSAFSYVMAVANALAALLLVYTATKVHADETVAVIYAFLLLCLGCNVVHNIARIVRRRRFLSDKELNGL